MALTIDEALQQGVSAHKEGKLQDAERIYRAILQSQPNHADANHNLGLLVLSIGKSSEALLFFKLALETNPETEQFWLSYIDALIKEKLFEEATRTLEDATKSSASREKLDVLHQQLKEVSRKSDKKVRDSSSVSEKRKKLAKKKKNREKNKTQGTPSGAEPSQDQLIQLLKHYQAGGLAEAEGFAVLLTQDFPNHPFAWQVLGALLNQTGRLPESLAAKQKFLKLSPQDATAHYGLGLVLQELGRLDEAVARYTQAIALKPGLTEAHNNLGNTLKDLGRLDESEASLRQAMALKPGYAEAHNNLGLALHEQERFREAEASYRQALLLTPGYAEARNNLGNTLTALGQLEKAEASYIRAIACKPGYAEAQNNLGTVLQAAGRLEECEASYRQAIAMNFDYVMAHYNLGLALVEMGKLSEAAASFQQAITLRPTMAEAHYDLANTLGNLGRLADCVASYRQAIAMQPNMVKAHSNLGNALRALGRLDESETRLRHAMMLKPDYAEAHNNLGVTLLELGRLDEAERCCQQAIALKPNMIEAHNNLGSTLRALARLDASERSYTKALALKPDFVSALLNRSILFFDRGDFEAALSDSDSCDTPSGRAFSFDALYALGRIDEIHRRIDKQHQLDRKNLRVAAFSAFISQKHPRVPAYNFCQEPLSFLFFSKIARHVDNQSAFIKELIGELETRSTIWESRSNSTTGGFQSPLSTNLFEPHSVGVAKLESIILDEIEKYFSRFQSEPCLFMQEWPLRSKLHGWHVVLKQQGYQSPHIHPGGWLSGVVYLKVVPSLGEDEGAIEFSLNGERYSDPDSSSLVYQPEPGDIIFFPSSLHHRTIPFSTDTDRIVVAFDLLPASLTEFRR